MYNYKITDLTAYWQSSMFLTKMPSMWLQSYTIKTCLAVELYDCLHIQEG